jgi:peptide/nickel transport system substrate-binding protein
MSLTSPTSGLRQLVQNLSVESLARLAEDGRLEPSLAESWTLANDARSLTVSLRKGVSFHDGSRLDAAALSTILPDSVRAQFGSVADDISQVRVVNDLTVELTFKHPAPFIVETLEAPIRKPGTALIGTGPFAMAPGATTELRANTRYYLGEPKLSEVRIQTFPSIRTAWAELLRDRLDMLAEVGLDALDSLESSTSIAVFRFTRRYQYAVVLNSEAPPLRSSAIRQALNMAIDRAKLVQAALNDHGVASSGPIWPRYWALPATPAPSPFDPQRAAATLGGKRLHFTCLIPTDAIYERLGLELQRQLGSVGVEMEVRAASPDQIFAAERARTYEAVLIELVSGPTILRLYPAWDRRSNTNEGNFGNATVDDALDHVRHAETDASYRQAVASLQRAFVDDPPAIFLAWIERARAVSRRFAVPAAESGRDILSTLRLWKPASEEARRASRN